MIPILINFLSAKNNGCQEEKNRTTQMWLVIHLSNSSFLLARECQIIFCGCISFFSALSVITNIQTRTSAHTYTIVLCVVRVLFYVNNKLFFLFLCFFSLSSFLFLSLALLSVGTCARTHSQYIYIYI
jgi:predicted CDP-diglyceride synthetase/phosphatidate cytidylyltransferase